MANDDGAPARSERSQRIIDSMNEARDGEHYGEWSYAAEQDPDFMEHYAAFSNALRKPTMERAIPAKYHELFYIVILAYRGFHWTLASHMRRAIKLGATKQEILEALEFAVTPGGAPVMHLGLRALMELEAEERAAGQQEPGQQEAAQPEAAG